MKKFLSFIGREIARSIAFGTFLILFIAWAVYALSYPSAPPAGEIAGGKFMQYFNSIKIACPAGQYLSGYDVNYNKICATAPTGPQGPAGANGAQGPQWPTGATGPQGPAGVSVGGTIHFDQADQGTTYGGMNVHLCPPNSVMVGLAIPPYGDGALISDVYPLCAPVY